MAEKLAGLPKLKGKAFNFSNESPITVLDLVKVILKLMASDLQPEIYNEANNEIRHQYLSASQARQELGWRPIFSLEEGMEKTIAWYKEFFASGAV